MNTAVEDMNHLCNSVLDKNPNNKLIISKVLPKVRAGRKTNNSLTMFNILVEDEFCEHKNVSFSHNNNLRRTEIIRDNSLERMVLILVKQGLKSYQVT